MSTGILIFQDKQLSPIVLCYSVYFTVLPFELLCLKSKQQETVIADIQSYILLLPRSFEEMVKV